MAMNKKNKKNTNFIKLPITFNVEIILIKV